MWDVTAGDFDDKCNKENVINNVLNNLSSGNIIVLHDNKNREKTLDTLPSIIKGIQERGFRFSTIPYLD